MSTRTLIDIKLAVTEPEALSEDLIFTLSTDGASEQVASDVALTYASQIDAMLGDAHTVEVAIATALFERQQAVVAAAQEGAAALAARLTDLGAKPKGAAKPAARRGRAAAKAEAAPAPEPVEEAKPEPKPEPRPAVATDVVDPDATPEVPAVAIDVIEPGDPAPVAVTDVVEDPQVPSTATEDTAPVVAGDDVPPADEPPAEDDVPEGEPVVEPAAEPVAQFYVPAPGANGEEDVTEF